MKNKKERAQALSDALDQLDEAMLQNAYDVDDAEKFRALGSSKAVKSEKTRTVTRFHLYTAVAACLVLAIGISMIVLENVPNFHLWGPDPLLNSVGTKPSTQPTDIGVAEIVDSGTCGDNLTWTLDANGTLIISGTGAIGDYAYSHNFTPWDADSVKEVIIGPGVTSIGVANFAFHSNLTGFSVDKNNEHYSNDGFGVLYNKEMTELIQAPCGLSGSYVIPDNVSSIGYMAFANCESLTGVTIGSGVTSIGDFAFGACSSLISITIPDSVTSIGRFAFTSCMSLTRATIGSGSIGDYAFVDCANLISVTLDSGVTTIGHAAFCRCSSLTHITIPDSVTSIGDTTFENCVNLTSVIIGSGVTSIGYRAFIYCYNLWHVMYTGSEAQWEMIEIDEDNEHLLEADRHNDYAGEKIMIAAMKFPTSGKESIAVYRCSICTARQSVTVPRMMHEHNDACGIACGTCGDDLTWTLDADGTLTISGTGPMSDFIDMLWDDEVVKKIIIKPGVTSIGEFVFPHCSDLTNVVIPASVTSIGRASFYDCENLYHVLYRGSQTQWDTMEIGNHNTNLQDAVRHYDCTGNEVVDADRRFCEICSAACAHTWDSGIRTQRPTCTEDGSIYYYCTLCNGTKTEAIPKLPHTYDNDDDTICNVCGHDRGDSGFPIWIPIVAIVAIGGIVALIVLKKKR